MDSFQYFNVFDEMWRPGLDANLEAWPDVSFVDESKVIDIQNLKFILTIPVTLLAIAADLMH